MVDWNQRGVCMKEVCAKGSVESIHNSGVCEEATQAFASMKEELDEHLLAINENTRDLDQQAAAVSVLEEKFEKLHLRMDAMHMMFRKLIMQAKVRVDLSCSEQKVFALLFEFGKYVPTKFIAEKACFGSEDLEETVTSLCDKGIPIERRVIGDREYLKMDQDFRMIQAREQIVQVSPSVMQQMENKLLVSFF